MAPIVLGYWDIRGVSNLLVICLLEKKLLT